MQTNSFLVRIQNQIRANLFGHILFYASGILILSLMAQLAIPLQPVPITFESSTVILLGFLLGARRAVSLVSAYLVLGFLGMPIFAGFSGGLGLLLTPKAGYFIGFIPAAFISGLCKDWNAVRYFWQRMSIAFFATAVIFFLGVAWFSVIANFKMAWEFGVMPFILTEMMKIIGVSIASGWIVKKG